MKKYIITMALFIFAVFNSGTVTCHAETENASGSLSYEYDAGDGYHINRGSVEVERLLNDTYVSLFFRLSGARYRIQETGSYFSGNAGKSGSIDGLDLGFRYYPIGHKSIERLFIGGAFGFYEKDKNKVDSDYYQDQDFDHDKITISGNTYRMDAEVGYRLNIRSTKFAVTPAVHFGYYWKSHAPDATYKGVSLSFTVFF